MPTLNFEAGDPRVVMIITLPDGDDHAIRLTATEAEDYRATWRRWR